MQCSIIIPTMEKNIPYLRACVKSIKEYSKEDHEIIAISNPGEEYDIPIAGIKRLHSEKQGQCVSVNMGVKEAKHEYILISDDDVIFPPNWEDLLEKAKEEEFVSGNFVENGKKGGVASPFITKDFGDNPANFDWDEWGKNDLAEDKWENGFGFPLICKKSFWEKIEGYDEEYDPWGSNCDSDLEYKVMLAGVMPRRWRGAPTYHFAQVSGIFTPDKNEFWKKNTHYFEVKWGIARAKTPEIWYADLVINLNKLRYKPEWAKLDSPWVQKVSIPQTLRLEHVGWITNKRDLFEKFWCDIVGFKKVSESKISKEMTYELFGQKKEMECIKYEKNGITIEIHVVDIMPEPHYFTRWGINHIGLWVENRDDFIRAYDFEVKVYHNPKGHRNIFIKDFEGNWIELKEQL